MKDFLRRCTTAIAEMAFAGVLAASSQVLASNDALPKDIDEGVARLEKLVGKFVPTDARQFRIKIASELKNQPEANKSPALIVSNGEVIFGTPYRIGGAVAFDMIESIKRTIYELGENGQKKITRRQQRYMAARWTLRVDEMGSWDFDCVFLTHSTPSMVGKPYLKGTVKWLSDGIELVGVGTDGIYAAEGKLIRAAVYAKIKLTREGDELSVNDTWRNYSLEPDPDGNLLPIPDFKRPIGATSQWLTGKANIK